MANGYKWFDSSYVVDLSYDLSVNLKGGINCRDGYEYSPVVPV